MKIEPYLKDYIKSLPKENRQCIYINRGDSRIYCECIRKSMNFQFYRNDELVKLTFEPIAILFKSIVLKINNFYEKEH